MNLRHLCSLLLLAAIGSDWQATWTPHAENVALLLVTECDQRHPFRAVQRFDIEPGASTARFVRLDVPDGAQCYVSGYVMRNPEPLNPEKEYSGEATVVSIQN